MARFLQLVRSRLAGGQQQFAEHPAADLLSAFAEQSLSAPERAGVLSHLAKCGECREVLALSSSGPEKSFLPLAHGRGSETPTQLLSRDREGAVTKSAFSAGYWRWVAAAVVPLLVLVVFWRRSPAPSPVTPPAQTTSPVTYVSPIPPKPISAPKIRPRRAAPLAKHASPILTPSVPLAEGPKWTQPEPLTESARGRSQSIAVNAAAPRLSLSNSFAARPMPIASGGSVSVLLDPTNPTGAIDKSADGGKTWRRMYVDDRSHFTALWSSGREIWVGGEDGVLFHSIDAGSNWTPIAVATEDDRLTQTIKRIDSSASGMVTLKVQSGGDWVTIDGGAHWMRP